MTDQAIALARKFHEAYERLAPRHGYKTQLATRTFDPDSSNGKLMIAVCAEIAPAMYAATRNQVLEDCARICESFALQVGDKYYGTSNGKQCAAAIRALLK